MKKSKEAINKNPVLIISIIVVALTLAIAMLFIVNAFLNDPSSPSNTNEQEIDYTEEEFEDALNAGENVIGKTVQFKVTSVHPDSFCGYNLWSGVHLNFCSSDNKDVSEGQDLVVRIKNVENTLGSYIIDYELIKK